MNYEWLGYKLLDLTSYRLFGNKKKTNYRQIVDYYIGSIDLSIQIWLSYLIIALLLWLY